MRLAISSALNKLYSRPTVFLRQRDGASDFLSLRRRRKDTLLSERNIQMNNEQIHVPRTRTVTVDGFKVELDLTSQVLAVGAPIDLDFDFEGGVEPGPAAAPLSATLGPSDSTA